MRIVVKFLKEIIVLIHKFHFSRCLKTICKQSMNNKGTHFYNESLILFTKVFNNYKTPRLMSLYSIAEELTLKSFANLDTVSSS